MAKKIYKYRGTRQVYIHNDLAQGASNLKCRVEKRWKANDRPGLAYDSLASLILTAFLFEAYINFLGHKCVRSWEEREGFNKKIDNVLGALDVKPDWDARPYSSIGPLKEFRDIVAHGKPLEYSVDKTSETPPSVDDNTLELRELNGSWVERCPPEFVLQAYDDVDAIWKQLVKAANIEAFETVTQGSGGWTAVDV